MPAEPRSALQGLAWAWGKEPREGWECVGDGLGVNASPPPFHPPPPFPRWGTGPTGGVRRSGSATLPAPPLCLHSNPRSWGRGESRGTQDGVPTGPFALG